MGAQRCAGLMRTLQWRFDLGSLHHYSWVAGRLNVSTPLLPTWHRKFLWKDALGPLPSQQDQLQLTSKHP